MVLHLDGSPWLTDDLDLDQIYLFETGRQPQKVAVERPCLMHQLILSANAWNEALRETSPHEASGMLGQTLFKLGFILMQLGLGRSSEELRQESIEARRTIPETKIELSDQEEPDDQLDIVCEEAGDGFGYAVQRRIRYEFLGRRVTKTFDFAEF